MSLYSLYSGIIISPWNCFDLLKLVCSQTNYLSYLCTSDAHWSHISHIYHLQILYLINHLNTKYLRIFCNFHKIHSPNLTPRWGTVGARAPVRIPPNLWKIQKAADFLRNQRRNMVAGTGLEPAASELWVIANILQPSRAQYSVYVIALYALYIVCVVVCQILYLYHKEQIKNNIRAAIISFSPCNRQLDSATQNSYTKISKRALSTDG